MAKTLTGVVVSTKMQKNIVVSVERTIRHPMYKKIIRSNKKYKAYVGDAKYNVGDTVSIVETRPLSKDTHFKVVVKKTL